MIANKLLQNTDTVIGKDELLDNLHDGRKLKIKFGVDPTRPDLTFGHLVVFNKLRQFQDAGHETILLIGDYTARIGDPSGRKKSLKLPPLIWSKHSKSWMKVKLWFVGIASGLGK
jgi:tyrosyl-tRNA synthetase